MVRIMLPVVRIMLIVMMGHRHGGAGTPRQSECEELPPTSFPFSKTDDCTVPIKTAFDAEGIIPQGKMPNSRI